MKKTHFNEKKNTKNLFSNNYIFHPATGSPTTTMLRLRPGYYPYGQIIIKNLH